MVSLAWEERLRDFFIAKFSGDEADEHRLPAYEATQSLYGVSRSLLIVANYLAEGRVRRRDFRPSGYQLNIVAQREGSFETVFELVTNPEALTIYTSLGLGVGANFLTDFVKTVYRRSIGRPGLASIENLEQENKLNSGDVSALVDAIEPSVKAAHTSVGMGASQIVIIKGDNNVVKFNEDSKRYVWDSRRAAGTKSKLFSVASYNANGRNGRVFDFEEGKTIAFEMSSDVDARTIRTITDGISRYAQKRMGADINAAIALKYISIVAQDGRLKKIVIEKARADLDGL